MMVITGKNSKVAHIGFTSKLLTEIVNFSIKNRKFLFFFAFLVINMIAGKLKIYIKSY